VNAGPRKALLLLLLPFDLRIDSEAGGLQALSSVIAEEVLAQAVLS
jgi:hypothetical protein